ncbi:SDR family NAD(P)-dependent oxidoreductase [Salmonirosea aquatica]|uniref:SDR family NAD(P)-dependent oxidoreductase n=1 Tax=Salmonirosea aquatica TaxID=2654236 RepID=A0A7C9BGD6_9BACT|nr:SDR family NAD(P)-dependent oxidoreductase [Cytophagaceae bacterium SJW1-29]
MAHASGKTISVVGCGWLGKSLAERLLVEGYLVKGSTTSPAKLAGLKSLGIEAYVASLSPDPRGEHWSELLDVDTVIVDIPPRVSHLGGDFHPQQMDFLAAMLNKTSVSKIIYVSSTSVYPELNRVMTEADVLESGQSASPGLVLAENRMLDLASASRRVTVLRCGGLMGYDRIPGKYVRGKQNMTTGSLPVNYIHRDDVIGIVSALLRSENPDGVYNAVAPQHPSRREVYETSCAEFGWESPTFKVPTHSEKYKLVSSDKLGSMLDYTFQYPDPLTFHYELFYKTRDN